MTRETNDDRKRFEALFEGTLLGALETWEYKGLKVYYRRKLDGGGRYFAPKYVELIKAVTDGVTCGKGFEWCAGPGFMGFALLASGICEKICLADINPLALECVQMTVSENGLEKKVTWYLSDNLDSVPTSERFDLVVSNPPNYFRINPDFPAYEKIRGDLRPNDPEWRIHRKFYSQIRQYLAAEAMLFINEIEPSKAEVRITAYPRIPFDIRQRPAINDFTEMIAAGGLEYVRTLTYRGLGVEMGAVISRNKA